MSAGLFAGIPVVDARFSALFPVRLNAMFTGGSDGGRPTPDRRLLGLGRSVVTTHRLWLALSLVGALMFAAAARAQTPPVPAATPSAPAPADSSTPAAGSEPIGNVATLTGIATVIRNKNSLPLHLRDDIFLNDQVQTSSSSSLGITFNDATTFNLSANAKITIDNYIYEDGGKQNAGIFDIGKGTVAFVAAAVAKTGDMKITTPTSTLGIRGTTGLVEVPEGGTAAAGAAN